RLGVRPHYILTDALKVPGFTAPYLPVIGGDFNARCIAAASVLAKASWDRIMAELEQEYPGYGLAQHKGSGTAVHTEAIERLGATDIHRMSYSNVPKARSRFVVTKIRPSNVEGEK